MRRSSLLVLTLVACCLLGCDRKPAPATPEREKSSASVTADLVGLKPGEKPRPPLQLSEPPTPPETVGGENLRSMTDEQTPMLAALARRAAGTDYNRAPTYQYWYVRKSHRGQYDLACYLCRTRKIDAAFYWLQLAAIEEGVDGPHAQNDPDLKLLRADPRWPLISQYILDCNQYFQTSKVAMTLVVVPKNYKVGTPIPVILWLHGMGSSPSDFVGTSCQAYADMSNVAIVGVSGTIARGPTSFGWAEESDKDAQRIRAALTEVSDRVTVQEGQIIALGFSQGAQVAFDQAVRSPEMYAGAIVLSPGLAHADLELETLAQSPLLAHRGFVVSCGASEHPLTLKVSRADVAWLSSSHAHLIHMEYPGVQVHSFPDDFDERFEDWIKFILKAQEK